MDCGGKKKMRSGGVFGVVMSVLISSSGLVISFAQFWVNRALNHSSTIANKITITNNFILCLD